MSSFVGKLGTPSESCSEVSTKLHGLLKGQDEIVNYPLILICGTLKFNGGNRTSNRTDGTVAKVGYIKKEYVEIEKYSHAVKEGHTQGSDFEDNMESLSGVQSVKQFKDETGEKVDFSSQDSKIQEGSDIKDSSMKSAKGLVKRPNDSSDSDCEVQMKVKCTPHKVTCISEPSCHSLSWPVLESGVTKMFVPLKEGKNLITFRNKETNDSPADFVVTYEPMKNKRFVRPVYVICTDSDGSFDTPAGEDNSIESAKQRISFNARILQTFTAENLNCHGFGRRTFRIEEDENGNVKVNLFESNLKLEKALSMTGSELYSYFHEELKESSLYDPFCKLWVFMSCTRYKPPNEEFDDSYTSIPRYVKGHTALGGGNMALFGTGGLHNWAKSLEELVSRFTDCQKVDRKCLFDDSSRRGYYWANYSTTLGAAMHELGHTFNLPHTPSGIMGRGFDDMYQFFLSHQVNDVQSKSIATPLYMDPYEDGGAHWHRSSAAILSCSRWIGDRSEDETPVELPVPIIYMSANKRGPVGGNTDDTPACKRTFFNSFSWLKSENLVLKGFRLRASKYIDAIQIIGSKNYSNDGEETTVVCSKWFGNAESEGKTHEFLITSEVEALVSFDVRAGDWVDAIRFHSSHKSSVWFGGHGGSLYRLCFEDGQSCDGIFGTANGQHVLSLGATRASPSEEESDNDLCFFSSDFGIRVVELRRKDGESMKHWEYLVGSPIKIIGITKKDLFIEKASSVAVYDGCGECNVYNVDDLINLHAQR